MPQAGKGKQFVARLPSVDEFERVRVYSVTPTKHLNRNHDQR